MTSSPEIAELAAAMVKAQTEIGSAKKTADNPFFHSKYADLAEVWNAVREPLTKNGLCVIQPASSTGDTVTVTTRIMHTSGQWIEEPLTVTLEKTTPQAAGSAITYLRRYGLQAMTGVPSEDDDAEGAEGRGDGNGNGKKPRHDDSTITGKPAHTLGERLTSLIADSRLTEEERTQIRTDYRAKCSTDKQRGEFLDGWKEKVSARPAKDREDIPY